MKPSLKFRELDESILKEVLTVKVSPEQERFVSSVSECLREAKETPEGCPWYRAVYIDSQAVGFVMISWNVKPNPPYINGPWFLWKLIVDQKFQGQGYGRSIVEHIIEIVRKEGATELLTSFQSGEGSPGPFYKKMGFIPRGDYDPEGEAILLLRI